MGANSVTKKRFTCGRSYRKYSDDGEYHLFMSNGWFVKAKVHNLVAYLPESGTYVYRLRSIERIKKRRDLEQPLLPFDSVFDDIYD